MSSITQYNRQAWNALLDWLSANLTAAGQAILDDASAEAQLGTLGIASRVQHGGRPATGHVRLRAAGSDGDTITITVGAAATVYELESGGGVAGGNIAVTIGGTAAQTATNLRAAIQASQGSVLASAVHATNTSTVDLRVTTGAALALAESTGGVRIVVQDNGEEQAAAARRAHHIIRTLTAEDATRGRVRVDTGLASIDWWVGKTDRIGWDGVGAESAGVVELTTGASFPLQAGDQVEIIALGVAA